jgi:hypothetical protein
MDYTEEKIKPGNTEPKIKPGNTDPKIKPGNTYPKINEAFISFKVFFCMLDKIVYRFSAFG